MKKIIGKFFNYRNDPTFYDFSKIAVEVSERDNIRSMHIGSKTVQSSMSLKNHNRLVLNYTKVIVLCLIFNPAPSKVLFLGLGGGSLQKFFFQYCEKTFLRTLEINPQVIQVARSFFYLPDSERSEIISDDGVDYLSNKKGTYDIIISDAFDDEGLPDAFREEQYYELCHSRLTKKGIFIINLWGSDPKSKTYIKKIKKIFNNQVLFAAADNPGNLIVFAFRAPPKELRVDQLKERVKYLEDLTDTALMLFYNRLIESASSINGHRLNF